LTGKRFELFREMLPTVKRVAVLSDPLAAEQVRAVEAANRSMGLKLQLIELQNQSYDFESAFRVALRSQAEALLVLTLQSFVVDKGRVPVFVGVQLASLYLGGTDTLTAKQTGPRGGADHVPRRCLGGVRAPRAPRGPVIARSRSRAPVRRMLRPATHRPQIGQPARPSRTWPAMPRCF
jgi:hypothetical protein